MNDWPVLSFAADSPALISGDQTITWHQLRERVDARARELATPPHAPLVYLHARNSPELVIDILAHRASERIPVLLNPRWPTALAESLFADAVANWQGLLVKPGAIADVLFTSGSTGIPKAVVHSRMAQRISAEGANRHLPFAPGHRWLMSLSLCHVGGFGILERALCGGGAMVLPNPDETLWESCLHFGVTHLSLVRAQLVPMLNAANGVAALQKCAAVLVGGGPCPPEIFQKALAHEVPVAQTWGLTETCAQVCTSGLGQPDTCGVPLPHRSVKRCIDGRLAVAGPMLATGYLIGSSIALPQDADGFFVTQDLGEIDSDGRVSVLGRADLVFDSGGENIHPEQIENLLLRHPHIEEAIVVPIPDARWGHRPVAFVHTREPITEGDLRDFLSAGLPRFCIPDAFYPWPEDESRLKPSRARLAALAAKRYEPVSSTSTR